MQFRGAGHGEPCGRHGHGGRLQSRVSRPGTEIGECIHDFLARATEGDELNLWLDATEPKVCVAGRLVLVAVALTVGLNVDGRCEVLGMVVGSPEAEPVWLDVLRTLGPLGTARREACPLQCPKPPQGGGDEGAVRDLARCRVHFARNAFAHADKPNAASSRSGPTSPMRSRTRRAPNGRAHRRLDSAPRCRGSQRS
ncbi:transposase [Belnapia arida]|uniref:transposase n=1 Tax=Belnapia arida TaxID=2804533 RepID=UPI0038B401A2